MSSLAGNPVAERRIVHDKCYLYGVISLKMRGCSVEKRDHCRFKAGTKPVQSRSRASLYRP